MQRAIPRGDEQIPMGGGQKSKMSSKFHSAGQIVGVIRVNLVKLLGSFSEISQDLANKCYFQ